MSLLPSAPDPFPSLARPSPSQGIRHPPPPAVKVASERCQQKPCCPIDYLQTSCGELSRGREERQQGVASIKAKPTPRTTQEVPHVNNSNSVPTVNEGSSGESQSVQRGVRQLRSVHRVWEEHIWGNFRRRQQRRKVETQIQYYARSHRNPLSTQNGSRWQYCHDLWNQTCETTVKQTAINQHNKTIHEQGTTTEFPVRSEERNIAERRTAQLFRELRSINRLQKSVLD